MTRGKGSVDTMGGYINGGANGCDGLVAVSIMVMKCFKSTISSVEGGLLIGGLAERSLHKLLKRVGCKRRSVMEHTSA